MQLEQPEVTNPYAFGAAVPPERRLALTLGAGLVAALVAGGVWAALVLLTGYEVGYVAWGVGLLVGFAMTRATPARGSDLAVYAAGFAILGLFVGKAIIFAGSAGAIAKEYAADDEVMRGMLAWQMYDARDLDPATLEEIDATFAVNDTLSDALWASMTEQAGSRLLGMSDGARAEAATNAAQVVLQNVGLLNGVKAQLGPFDLLWILLAVSTAYRMMRSEPEPVPAEGA